MDLISTANSVTGTIGGIVGMATGIAGLVLASRANHRIDVQESLQITPNLDDDTGNSLLVIRLKIHNPLAEVVNITRIEITPPMHPQEVMNGQITPQATTHPKGSFNWDESIQGRSDGTIVLYYDQEKAKLEKYSITIRYRTSRGRNLKTTQHFSKGYSLFQ